MLNGLSCLSPIWLCTTRIAFQEQGDWNVEPVAYSQHNVDRGHAASDEMRLQSRPGDVATAGECIHIPARHDVHARSQIRGEYAVQRATFQSWDNREQFANRFRTTQRRVWPFCGIRPTFCRRCGRFAKPVLAMRAVAGAGVHGKRFGRTTAVWTFSGQRYEMTRTQHDKIDAPQQGLIYDRTARSPLVVTLGAPRPTVTSRALP